MSDAFDPYHRWLGIPPEEQPPNRYRLLGIKRFETDGDVIEAAADRQMGHLRTYQTGRHSELSQQLLNEVAAARVCLLSDRKKAAYDEQLKARTIVRATPLAEAPPAAVSQAVVLADEPTGAEPASVVPEPTGMVPDISVFHSSRTLRRKRTSWQVPAVMLIAAAAVLGGLFLLFRSEALRGAGHGRQEPPHSDLSAQGTQRPEVSSNQPVPRDDLPDATPGKETPDPEQSPAAGDGSLPESTPPGDSPDEGGNPGSVVGDLPGLGEPPPPPTPRREKTPIPPQQDQQKARELIWDIYSRPTTTEEKQALAKKLLQQASQTTDDAAAHFVMLTEAKDLAADGGDDRTAFQAIGQLDAAFAIDTVVMQADVLGRVVRIESQPLEHVRIADLAAKVMRQARKEDQFSTASEMAGVALAQARKARYAVMIKQVAAYTKEIDALAAAHAELGPALAALAADPDDADANLAAGRFYCLLKGDWEKGLPMLARASDVTLKDLAAKEQQANLPPEGRAELAKAWFELSELEADELAQQRLRLRAGHWYARAVPDLTGLAKSIAERRLDAIYNPPEYALAFDGQLSRVVVPSLRYDGSHPITIEAIVMPAGKGGRQYVACNIEHGGVGLGPDLQGKWQFAVKEGKKWRTALSARPATAQRWVHLAGIYDGQNVVLFVDGRLQPTRAAAATHKASGYPFVVGANPTSKGGFEEFFRGLVDEVRISNSVRYTDHFQPPRRLASDSDTMLLLHFDEGAGSTVYDSSSNKNHCTTVATRWVRIVGDTFLPAE